MRISFRVFGAMSVLIVMSLMWPSIFQEGRLKRDAKLDKSDDDQTDAGGKEEEVQQEKVGLSSCKN